MYGAISNEISKYHHLVNSKNKLVFIATCQTRVEVFCMCIN